MGIRDSSEVNDASSLVVCGFQRLARSISGSKRPRPNSVEQESRLSNAALKNTSTSLLIPLSSLSFGCSATIEGTLVHFGVLPPSLCCSVGLANLAVSARYWHLTPLLKHFEQSGCSLSHRVLPLAHKIQDRVREVFAIPRDRQ